MRFASLVAAGLVGVVGTVAPVEAQDEMMMSTTVDLTTMLSTTSNVMQTVNYTDPTDGMEMMSCGMVPADDKDKDKRPSASSYCRSFVFIVAFILSSITFTLSS